MVRIASSRTPRHQGRTRDSPTQIRVGRESRESSRIPPVPPHSRTFAQFASSPPPECRGTPFGSNPCLSVFIRGEETAKPWAPAAKKLRRHKNRPTVVLTYRHTILPSYRRADSPTCRLAAVPTHPSPQSQWNTSVMSAHHSSGPRDCSGCWQGLQSSHHFWVVGSAAIRAMSAAKSVPVYSK